MRQVFLQQSGVNREVIHALFALLHQGVAENLPRQVLGHAVYLFQGLVDGHRAHGHGTVADNPFARLVDMRARGEVHERVAAPTATPNRLFNLFVYGRRRGRVADVGVDFSQEMTADNHRFALHMVDVGRNDGAARGDFRPHEFGRDVRLVAGGLRVLVLAYGHVFHLFRNDALLRVVHLRQAAAGLGLARQTDMVESQIGQSRVVAAGAAIVGTQFGQYVAVAAPFQPGRPNVGQAFLQVDVGLGVGIGTARVIDIDRRVGRGHALAIDDIDGIDEVDLAHRHLYREQFALYIDFFRTWKGFAGNDFFFHVLFIVLLF